MERKSNLRQLSLPGYPNAYIFDESANIYGTIKDRRNRLIIEEATRLHVNKLVLITSGNNGYSLAKMAEGLDLKIVCVISRKIEERIKRALESVAYQVIELNLDQKILRPEELVTIARETDEEVIWDVTNGYEGAYSEVVREIAAAGMHPEYIVCPLGSGGIFIGLIEGVNHYSPGTKVIGIGTRETYQSYADKLSTPWSPYTRAIENSLGVGHAVFRLSEDEIRDLYRKYKHYGNFEPSSTIVFGALSKANLKASDTFVLINSGRSIA